MQNLNLFQTNGWIPFFSILIIAMVLVVAFRSLAEWNHNSHAPVRTVDAAVAKKKADPSPGTPSAGPDSAPDTNAVTPTFRVGFEVKNGGRMEFIVSERDYAGLAEGDTGALTFQGTRYLSFEKTKI